MVANVLELFKHNQFQIWAENSVFNQDNTSYTPWVKQPDSQYHALLQLLVVPHMHCDKKATLANSDIQAIKCTVSLHSIDGVLSPHQIRQLQVSPYIKEREHEEVGMRLPHTVPVNQTADREEHFLSQSAATQAHYDTDEQGLPIQVLYYSYSDLGLVLSKKRIQKIGGDCHKYSYLVF